MKRVLITGGAGQLGKSIKDRVENFEDINATFIDIETLDLTDKDSVREFFSNRRFDIIVNCAAFTAVDLAESQPDQAGNINTFAVRNIAEAARKFGFKIIHISTDYVFDGKKRGAYRETDAAAPHTVYGRTKLDGERALQSLVPDSIIIRTAWLYSLYGKNFFLTMCQKAWNEERVGVVVDQRGTPTNAGDLAEAILRIIDNPRWIPGVYHYSNLGDITWNEFAKEIYKLLGKDPGLVGCIKTSDLNSAAPRPCNSLLDKQKIMETFNISIPEWRESLKETVNEILKDRKFQHGNK